MGETCNIIKAAYQTVKFLTLMASKNVFKELTERVNNTAVPTEMNSLTFMPKILNLRGHYSGHQEKVE